MTQQFGGHARKGRSEDHRLLTGRGSFVENLRPADAANACVLRSPHAHARIVSVDTGAAAAMPGVLAILTGADVLADGLGGIPCVSLPRSAAGRTLPIIEPPYLALAADRVRFVGDAVALVVAETPMQARDAAEQVAIEYEPLPAVVETARAADAGAPQLWSMAPGNRSFVYELGDAIAVDAALARAYHVARVKLTISRVTANPIETRNAIGAFDRGNGRYTLTSGNQTPHQLKSVLAKTIFKVPESMIRIVSPDVGGGFGLKGGLFREQILVMWAARRLGRTVAWMGERGESLLSDEHARDNVIEAELGLDRSGRFLGLRVRSTANLGAYVALRGAHPPTNNLGSLSGVYTTPAIHARSEGVFSNTSPTSSYRGAGRPEATYVIERAIDVAADELGIDRLEMRRRNAIPAAAMPYQTGFLFTYDSGAFERNMTLATQAGAWAGFAARRALSLSQGKLRGIGIANCIEQAGGPYGSPWEERADLRFDPGGGMVVMVGTLSTGQGHETVFADMVASRFGIHREAVRVVQGDTDIVPFGRGSYGSRSLMVAGSAVTLVCEKVIAKGRRIAAHLFEAADADVIFEGGSFKVSGTDRALTFAEVVRAGFSVHKLPPDLAGGLDSSVTYAPKEPSYPNGCHVCEVEIDPDTGALALISYVVADDVGRVINPAMVEGQIHGGIAQGAGQALFENVIYDRDNGQLVTGSFMDYAMPRADDLPAIQIITNEVPCTTNPLGVKGAGEAGVIGSIPAVISAVVDALRPLGVRHIDMPATPERIWRAILEQPRVLHSDKKNTNI